MRLLLALLGVLLGNLAARVETSTWDPTATKRPFNPANCTIGKTTYTHGQTFKLDCKTQCVCENGRHACSTLCPNEQLPAPEDTISCRSPRLVEVPGHCCKMWLCENPTADVYATCHNASSTPWTPCSVACGMGTSTRFTSTTTGCRELSNLRLCENRKCDLDNKVWQASSDAIRGKDVKGKKEIGNHQTTDNSILNHTKNTKEQTLVTPMDAFLPEHRVRKGHECRNIQRLGPARVRLGACVSRKLYRPKLCGHCRHASKCCVPSVSSTIQVEMLCPLNAEDPISVAHKQQHQQNTSQLWDTAALEPIDQEYLQSHRIPIENKFITVEWILKCECGRNPNCNLTGNKKNNTIDNANITNIANNENRGNKVNKSKNNTNNRTTKKPDMDSHGYSRKLNHSHSPSPSHSRNRNRNRSRSRNHIHNKNVYIASKKRSKDVNGNNRNKNENSNRNRNRIKDEDEDGNGNGNGIGNENGVLNDNRNSKSASYHSLNGDDFTASASVQQPIRITENINNHIGDNHHDETSTSTTSGEQLPDIIPYPPNTTNSKNKTKQRKFEHNRRDNEHHSNSKNKNKNNNINGYDISNSNIQLQSSGSHGLYEQSISRTTAAKRYNQQT